MAQNGTQALRRTVRYLETPIARISSVAAMALTCLGFGKAFTTTGRKPRTTPERPLCLLGSSQRHLRAAQRAQRSAIGSDLVLGRHRLRIDKRRQWARVEPVDRILPAKIPCSLGELSLPQAKTLDRVRGCNTPAEQRSQLIGAPVRCPMAPAVVRRRSAIEHS